MTKFSKSPKILCVDDDRIINKLLSHFLERQGFEIRTANNGQEAIEIAQEWLPDLIITLNDTYNGWLSNHSCTMGRSWYPAHSRCGLYSNARSKCASQGLRGWYRQACAEAKPV